MNAETGYKYLTLSIIAVQSKRKLSFGIELFFVKYQITVSFSPSDCWDYCDSNIFINIAPTFTSKDHKITIRGKSKTF